MLTWSYDSLVPSYRLSRETRNVLRVSDARYIAITDPEMMVYKELSDGIPGFIQVCIPTTHSKHCNILFSLPYAATRCNTLQHAATRRLGCTLHFHLTHISWCARRSQMAPNPRFV